MSSSHVPRAVFPPTSPKAPPLFTHPAIHASHFLVSSLLATPKSATLTPLRPFAALHERVQNAHLLKTFDDSRQELLRGPAGMFFDQQGTAVYAVLSVERICFSIPEPEVIDALDVKPQVEE
jgi:hypothetical protein